MKVQHSRVDKGTDPIDVSSNATKKFVARCPKSPSTPSTEIEVPTQRGDCPPGPFLKCQGNKGQDDLLENSMRYQLLSYTNQLEEHEELFIESPRIDSNKTAEQRKAPHMQDRVGYKNFRPPMSRSRLLESQL
jgi:hypothetical protein